MSADPTALIDLSALRHNLNRARAAASGSRMLAVIKANGYGHGLLRVAGALDEAEALAVARIGEGVRLREAGENRPIAILEGFFDPQELQAAIRHRLEPVIHEPGQIECLERHPPGGPFHCWLKIDSGMHRLGFPVTEAAEAFRRLSAIPALQGRIRAMTHLANADDRTDVTTERQLEQFLSQIRPWGVESSIANSAGILGWKASHSEWVRPGIMLYGASPFLDRVGEEDGLLPVMTLQSRVIAVNTIRKGEGIGYGGDWKCPEDMRVGVIAIGYGDGYPRHATSGTPVLVNGKRVPLVGRVSMDMITVDLRKQPEARAGDPAILWGRGLPAEEIARAAGTIPYELFCGITTRVEFVETGVAETTQQALA